MARNFDKPEDLLYAWNLFKEDLKEQSIEWLKIQYVGKNGERKEDPSKVPMTFEGFKRFCRLRYGRVEQYFKNQDSLYADFDEVCTQIKDEIRENQIIGGMLGFFNHSITARLNGLVEKSSVDLKTEQPLYPDGTDKK